MMPDSKVNYKCLYIRSYLIGSEYVTNDQVIDYILIKNNRFGQWCKR